MTQFKAGDKIQFDADEVHEADRIDKEEYGGTRGYAEGIIRKGGLETGGIIENPHFDTEAPFQIVLPDGRKCWAEEEWLKTPDKFQPGDVVNWVSESGRQMANGAWDGSTVVGRGTTNHYKDYYKVTHPERGYGTIHQDELVLAEKPVTEISDLMDKSFSMTFSVVPEVKNPDAPTLKELNKGIDISEYITDLTGFSPFPHQVEIMEDLVNHPAHYGGEDDVYEVIKVIEAWGLGFHLGNAVKYIPRAGVKDPDTEIQDLEKSRWYIDRRIQWLKENENV